MTTLTRHWACGCKEPCQEMYRCEAPGHIGGRMTPVCNGAADDLPGYCDVCWCVEHKPAAAILVRSRIKFT